MKMIDIWLLTGLFIPFVIFIILITLDILMIQEKSINPFGVSWMQEKDKELGSTTLLKTSKILIPFTTLAFCFIYWCVALYYSDQF